MSACASEQWPRAPWDSARDKERILSPGRCHEQLVGRDRHPWYLWDRGVDGVSQQAKAPLCAPAVLVGRICCASPGLVSRLCRAARVSVRTGCWRHSASPGTLFLGGRLVGHRAHRCAGATPARIETCTPPHDILAVGIGSVRSRVVHRALRSTQEVETVSL